MAGRMIHEMGQKADNSLKEPMRLGCPFISQAIFVRMSSDVDDGSKS
jgi:hypothetical protein